MNSRVLHVAVNDYSAIYVLTDCQSFGLRLKANSVSSCGSGEFVQLVRFYLFAFFLYLICCVTCVNLTSVESLKKKGYHADIFLLI